MQLYQASDLMLMVQDTKKFIGQKSMKKEIKSSLNIISHNWSSDEHRAAENLKPYYLIRFLKITYLC